MHANPVGIVKKDIYVIKNDINKKMYVGQSSDVHKRFRTHCKPSNCDTLLGRDIKKYEASHFWAEVIEKGICNYDERERFWIQKLNTLSPRGYNVLPGGSEPPHYKGEMSTSSKLSNEEVCQIKSYLRNTSVPLKAIAKKFSISKRQIHRINQGISRSSLEETYPIRKIPNSSNKLSQEDVSLIIELLKYSYRFNGEIARQFGVSVHLISDINQGLRYRQPGEIYPIREWKSCGVIPFTYEQVTEIISLLKTTDLSFREIGRRYGVGNNLISCICYGTSPKYRRRNEHYPLRKIS